MLVNFGWVVNGKMESIASISVPTDNLLETAEEISTKYLQFKEILDKYGNCTYLMLSEDPLRDDLQILIDSYLDPILKS